LQMIKVNGLRSRKWEAQTEEEAAKLASKFEADRKVFEKLPTEQHHSVELCPCLGEQLLAQTGWGEMSALI